MDDSCSGDKKRASSWPGRSSEPQRQGHPGRQERCLLLQRQSKHFRGAATLSSPGGRM